MAKPGVIRRRIEVTIVTDRHGHVIAGFNSEFPLVLFTDEISTQTLETRVLASMPAVREVVLRATHNSRDPRMAEATHASVYIVPTDVDTIKILPWSDDSERTMPGVGTADRLSLIRKSIISKTIEIAQEENAHIHSLVTPTMGVEIVSTPGVVIPEPRRGIHDADADAVTAVLIAVCGRYHDDPNNEEFTLSELDMYLPPFFIHESGLTEDEYLERYHVLINWALTRAFGYNGTTSLQDSVTVTRVVFGQIPVADFPSVEGKPRNMVLNSGRFTYIDHFVPEE